MVKKKLTKSPVTIAKGVVKRAMANGSNRTRMKKIKDSVRSKNTDKGKKKYQFGN